LPYAVVDGNVMRVLSRYLGIDVAIDSSKGKKIFAEAAQELLDKENPAVYNQAIMEFGATFCIPVKPDCENCIFNDSCEAFRQKKVNELPYKSKRTKITKRYFHYFILTYKDNTYIRKRKPGDIWQGLYEFPLYEANSHLEFDDLLKTEFFKKEIKNSNPHLIKVSAIKKHILSHQHIFALFYHLHLYRPFKNKQYIEIPIKTINNYAFPRLINRYLEEEKIIQ
jgi:A/G-specific adenine glycosylase